VRERVDAALPHVAERAWAPVEVLQLAQVHAGEDDALGTVLTALRARGAKRALE
jgi:hypothetical protein